MTATEWLEENKPQSAYFMENYGTTSGMPEEFNLADLTRLAKETYPEYTLKFDARTNQLYWVG